MFKIEYSFKRFSKSLFTVLCILACCSSVQSQYDHIDVFPGEQGVALFNNVQAGFTPLDLLTWSDTRDTMFAEVWGVNDSLACIYTGHTLYMNPNEDPTQTVFMDGVADGINTEHVYPQSMGASDGNARINMHNLFPCKVNVNTVRGSLPYGEINDNETTNWYLGNTIQNNIPQTNRDAYSEFGNGMFEPRESVKGDIARTVMYFYTIYRSEADAANPDFFELQREDMCNWHFGDPVDQKEWEGNLKIATYQDGLSNPFVLDCSLAARMYCDNISDACNALDTNEDTIDASKINVFPNPVENILKLELASDLVMAEILLFDANARLIMTIDNAADQLSIAHLHPGIYLLKFRDTEGRSAYRKLVKN